MIAGSICAFYRGQPLKDWLSFCDKFGIPGIIGSVDGQPGSEPWVAMESAVASIVTDWAAVKSHGDTIEILETKRGGGALPFLPLIDYLDQRIAVLWRGADLSTLAMGGAAVGASLQGDETAVLIEDDAALITETLNDQLDRHVIAYHFGDAAASEPLAYFKLLPPKRQSLDAELKIDDFLLRAGAPLAQRATLERYGRPTPDAGDDLLTPPAPVQSFNGSGNFGGSELANSAGLDATRQAVRDAVAHTLDPLRDAIARRLRR
jgi:hypothetical protein